MTLTLATVVTLLAIALAAGFAIQARRLRGRLAAEATASRSREARLERILELSPIAIAVIHADGRVERVNQYFRELFGYAPGEIQSLDQWWPRAYPDENYRRQAIQSSLEMVEASRRSGHAAGPRELHVHCRDGSARDIEFHYVDLGESGVWAMSDVSQHYQNEEVARLANEHLLTQLEENQRLQEALREQATRDPLTGLVNRRYLDETLDRELARAMREGYPVAVMMIDIDYFKRLNDTYGHLAGDEMLRALATLFAHGARTEDIICRFGGEEFAIVLPKMPLDIAHARADEWRAKFEHTPVPFGEFALRSTLSVGIAMFPGNGRSRDQLIDAADAALYRAKHAGRNRVEVAEASRLTAQ